MNNFFLTTLVSLFFFNVFSQVSLSNKTVIKVSFINLPTFLNTQQLTLTHNLNNWDTTTAKSVVSNGRVNFIIEYDGVLAPLSESKEKWHDVESDFNFAFKLINTQNPRTQVIAYFYTNQSNFRIKINQGKQNDVVIDADHQNSLIIDQDKYVLINNKKVKNLPVQKLDATKFSFPYGKWKAIIVSYDDGTIEDREVVRILNKNGIVGTFNILTGGLDKTNYVTTNEINSLYKNHEISGHTHNHNDLSNENRESIHNQVKTCNNILTEIVQDSVKGMAYPYGSYNNITLDVLKELNIEYARTTLPSYNLDIPNDFSIDFLRWNPTSYISEGISMNQKIKNWNQEKLAILHLRGHSTDYKNDADFEKLDKICNSLGGQKDVWYAKSIDVVRYLKAASKVVEISAGVYRNPSKISVWVKTKEGIQEIKPMDTLSVPENTKLKLDKLDLFPNPCGTQISISSDFFEDSDFELNIFDTLGNLVDSVFVPRSFLEGNVFKYDTVNLKNGLYFFYIKIEGDTLVKKIVVNK